MVLLISPFLSIAFFATSLQGIIWHRTKECCIDWTSCGMRVHQVSLLRRPGLTILGMT